MVVVNVRTFASGEIRKTSKLRERSKGLITKDVSVMAYE